MKNFTKIGLGIVTSIAGYLEVGSIGTAVQAGAQYRYALLWSLALGTICIAFLCEMTGRLAAVSKHTVTAAVRERFGIDFQIVPLTAQVIVDFMVLTAEIGGICLALQFLTGVSFRWWAFPVAIVIWFFLWRGTFGLIENGVAILGLVTLCFLVAAIRLHPHWTEVAGGIIPSLPGAKKANYLFLAVSIIGATISPYMMTFYSSGAVEEKWGEDDLRPNRIVAGLGITFGSAVSMGVMVVAAMVLGARGIVVDRYEQAAVMLNTPFGRAGFFLFAISLAVGCFGAALEISLDVSYIVAQAFGWNWSEDQRAAEDARFSMVYTAMLLPAAGIIALGVDPLKLTIFTMALTVVVLPLVVMPLLVLMNDPRYLKKETNGVISNVAVVLITLLSFALAIVAIPLQIIGS